MKLFFSFWHSILHTPTAKVAYIWDAFIALLVVLSLSMFPLHVVPYLHYVQKEAWIIEAIITIIFTFEYLLKIASAKKTLIYLFSFIGMADLFSILPLYLEYYDILPNILPILVFVYCIRIIKLIFIYIKERKAFAEEVKNGAKKHGDFKMLSDEKVFSIIQKHPLLFLLSIFPVFLFALFAVLIISIFGSNMFSIFFAGLSLLIALLIFIKNWLNFHYDVIYVTDHRLVIQDKNIFGVDRNSILYASLTNIHPRSSGLSNLIFGYGDIMIETATTSQEKIIFSYAPHPEKAARIISEIQRNLSRSQSNSAQKKWEKILSSPEKNISKYSPLKLLQQKIKNRIYNLKK